MQTQIDELKKELVACKLKLATTQTALESSKRMVASLMEIIRDTEMDAHGKVDHGKEAKLGNGSGAEAGAH